MQSFDGFLYIIHLRYSIHDRAKTTTRSDTRDPLLPATQLWSHGVNSGGLRGISQGIAAFRQAALQARHEICTGGVQSGAES